MARIGFDGLVISPHGKGHARTERHAVEALAARRRARARRLRPRAGRDRRCRGGLRSTRLTIDWELRGECRRRRNATGSTALAIAALSLGASARLIMRFGATATLIPGLVLAGAGLVLFRRAGVGADYLRDLLPVMLLPGVGAGLAVPAYVARDVGRTPSESGLASGVFQTRQQVGAALGLACPRDVATHAERLTSAPAAQRRTPALTRDPTWRSGSARCSSPRALGARRHALRDRRRETAPAEDVAGARPGLLGGD